MQTIKYFPINLVFDSVKNKWNKKPAIPKGQDWHTYEASQRELNHAKNIGIIIPQNIVVIDVDTHKGVTTDDIDEALGCLLDWESSQVQETPSGGAHYAFTLPEGVVIRQGSDLLGLNGFDTRTSGKGWIASGENYKDLTLIGLPHALCDESWPMLNANAVHLLSDTANVDDEDNDLMSLVISQPIEDLSNDEIQTYIDALPTTELEGYDTWLKVGMALFHQFKGKKQGFTLWSDWSKQSSNYDLKELQTKWRSFAKSRSANPITFAHIIYKAGGQQVIINKKVESLEDKALQVCDKQSYIDFKDEVLSISRNILPDDLRAMLADTVAKKAGKEIGLNKTEIKKALTPIKKGANKNFDDEIEKPSWANNWVYIEKQCEFANTELNYSIKREAFNAKFDRNIECIIAEKSAATLTLNDYQIQTVVDTMFWPGANRIFEYERKEMLNNYHESGCTPCGVLDDDAQDVIDLFLAHIDFTLSDEREKIIFLDWMAYIVQNPGKRINWALLLQGAQGTGKSYFVNVMQLILGENVRNLEPMAIAGRFTGWAHGSLLVAVEEIRIQGANRYEILDRLKPIITNDSIQIEEKGKDHKTVPNFTNYLLLTNHKDAIPLTSGDRRYCVMFSRVQSEQQLFAELGGEDGASKYFTNLFDESKRRPDALSRFLRDHKISKDFTPQGRAPETNARKKMMNISMSPERLSIEDAISQHNCEIINDTIVDITQLSNMMMMDGEELPKTRTMSAILLEMGYESIDNRRVKIKQDSKYHYVWIKSEHLNNDQAKQIIRDYYHEPF